ncbi:MAG: family 10 glycosylhydrolase [Pirellulales bacterium]|nr:family 10 glycosylhydrolase [Pirellulales bacterium]
MSGFISVNIARYARLAACFICVLLALQSPRTAFGTDPITLEQLRAARELAKNRDRKLIFNNDGGDVLYGATHTPQGLLDVRTSGLAGTQVDSIFYTSRSSGFGLFTHNTQVGEIFTSTGGRYSNNMTQSLINQGTDVLEVTSDFAHSNNMEMFWSMRMNDTHDASGESAIYAFPQLKVDHPEWLMGTASNHPAYGAWTAIDYGVQQVRDLALDYFEEVCQNYDVDGIELDFFRHPFFFRSHTSGGTATQADRDQMTQLVRDIRTMTEQVGMQRGSPILVSIRVPDSLGYSKDVGLDITQWLQEGLVDTMTVSDYFRAEEWNTSVALGHQYGVPVYAGLSESRMSGDAGTIRGSLESYMARASEAWQAGVDGIYMFNFTDDHSDLWKLAGDPATLQGVNKVYTTEARGVNYMNSSLANGLQYLNLTVVSPERTMSIAPSQFKTIPLTIGDNLTTYTSAEARVRLRLQVANLLNANGLSVRINNQLLSGGMLANGYLDYSVPLSLVNQGVNNFSIVGAATLTQNVTLKDLLLYVNFRPTRSSLPRVYESFLTGAPPNVTQGQYAVAPLLATNPSPDVSRFAGSWQLAVGSHAESFQVVGTGLTFSDMATSGGAVRFSSSTDISGSEIMTRTFDSSDVTTDDRVFYLTGMMSFDSSFSTASTSAAYTGLLNAEEGAAVPWTIGLQWGFKGNGNGGVDAVVRYRDNATNNPVVVTILGNHVAAGTHLFVMRVDTDVSGSTDNVTVWLDPTDTWAEGLQTLTFDAACWLLPSTDPNRLVDTLALSVTNVGANANVVFDEIRLGDSWDDLFLPISMPVAGDFDSDGDVDAADYIVWRKTGINGQQGYDDWRANFGRTTGNLSSGTSTAVPEPTTAAVLILLATICVSPRRFRWVPSSATGRVASATRDAATQRTIHLPVPLVYPIPNRRLQSCIFEYC